MLDPWKVILKTLRPLHQPCGGDLFDVLVLRLIDNLLPVFAIGRSLDGVTIGGVVFLPEDADILNVRRFLELNL